MLSRRSVLAGGVGLAAALASSPLLAATAVAFSQAAFAAAQKQGKSILIDVFAPWCPTCKAQAPILSELEKDPKFADFAVFRVDFDHQKAVLKQFGVRMQSTLIVFKGDAEKGRSVGQTSRDSIAALLTKAA
jgi:thioredoxin